MVFNLRWIKQHFNTNSKIKSYSTRKIHQHIEVCINAIGASYCILPMKVRDTFKLIIIYRSVEYTLNSFHHIVIVVFLHADIFVYSFWESCKKYCKYIYAHLCK